MKKLTILLSLLIASCVKPPQDGTVMLVEKVKIVEAGKPDINIDKLVNFEPDENHTLFLQAVGRENMTFEEATIAARRDHGESVVNKALNTFTDTAVMCKPFKELTSNGIIATVCSGSLKSECIILTHNKTGEQAAYCSGST